MHGSILIIGASKAQRTKYVENILLEDLKLNKLENNPDLFFLTKENKNSIGNKQIKELLLFINQKPFSHENKAVVISEAGLLTPEAQNALLKTLEELPSYASIILGIDKQNALLPTIISRCFRINLKNTDKKENNVDYKILEILALSVGDRLSMAGEISKEDSEIVIEILSEWIMQLHEILLENPTKYLAKVINDLQECKNDLETTNVNQRLALESLLINL